jgi:histidine triad (HIT) family protein
MATQGCIFCKIPKGAVDAQILYRDEGVYVINDISPQAPVHLLIIPLQHLASLAYVGPGQISVMGQIFVVAEEMARRHEVTLSGYRLVLNQGPDAGQAIEHAHVHLLGGKGLPALG